MQYGDSMYPRILDLTQILERKSVFLFGPRQTGKSTLLRTRYPDALCVNLLSNRVYQHYLTNSGALESDVLIHRRTNKSNIVIIDEVQKLPPLLDEVHNQIESDKELRFIITGSSARKLKRDGANLLGGRASWRSLFPLVYPEISERLRTIADIERRLLVGGLPSIFDSSAPFADWDDYIQLYLNEEIKAEGFVRNHEAFHRFLLTSALVNSKQINFTQVGSDAQVPPRTIHDYFQILEDTLIGHTLQPFTETKSRKAVTSAKFYLFDTGLTNALLGRTQLRAGTPEFGDIFEQFVLLEVKAYLSYFGKRAELTYWRSTSHFEVDLIVKDERGQLTAIELKTKTSASNKDQKGLLAFAEDFPSVKKIIVTLDERRSIETSGVEVISIFEFLPALWSGELF